jgi:hypothetical protein
VETEPVLLMTSPPATAKDCHGAPGVGRHISVPDYWALTKPEVNLLIVITTFAGFCLGRPTSSHPFPFLLLIHTMLGTLMVAGGTGTLNQYIERSFDAKMRRTARSNSRRNRTWAGKWRNHVDAANSDDGAATRYKITRGRLIISYSGNLRSSLPIPAKTGNRLCSVILGYPSSFL